MLHPQKHTAITAQDKKEFLEIKNRIKEINLQGLKRSQCI